MDRKTAPHVDAALQRFLRRLERTFRPTKVILFGSRAKGDDLTGSDVDLVVVSRAFEDLGWRERILRVTELWDGKVSLEPLCYTPAEFEERSGQISIVREAVRDGVVLIP